MSIEPVTRHSYAAPDYDFMDIEMQEPPNKKAADKAYQLAWWTSTIGPADHYSDAKLNNLLAGAVKAQGDNYKDYSSSILESYKRSVETQKATEKYIDNEVKSLVEKNKVSDVINIVDTVATVALIGTGAVTVLFGIFVPASIPFSLILLNALSALVKGGATAAGGITKYQADQVKGKLDGYGAEQQREHTKASEYAGKLDAIKDKDLQAIKSLSEDLEKQHKTAIDAIK